MSKHGAVKMKGEIAIATRENCMQLTPLDHTLKRALNKDIHLILRVASI